MIHYIAHVERKDAYDLVHVIEMDQEGVAHKQEQLAQILEKIRGFTAADPPPTEVLEMAVWDDRYAAFLFDQIKPMQNEYMRGAVAYTARKGVHVPGEVLTSLEKLAKLPRKLPIIQ